jgi:hypothetical protein
MRSLWRADGVRKQTASNAHEDGAQGFPLLWMQRDQNRIALTPPEDQHPRQGRREARGAQILQSKPSGNISTERTFPLTDSVDSDSLDNAFYRGTGRNAQHNPLDDTGWNDPVRDHRDRL